MNKYLIFLLILLSVNAASGPTKPIVRPYFDSGQKVVWQPEWATKNAKYPTTFIDEYYMAGPFYNDFFITLTLDDVGYYYNAEVTFRLYLIDSNGNGAVVFVVNDITYSTTKYLTALNKGSDVAFDNGPDFTIPIKPTLLSRETALNFKWYSIGTTPPKTKSKTGTNYKQGWAISDVNVTIYNCVENCILCFNNARCTQCDTGYYKLAQETYDECLLCPLNDAYCVFDQISGIYTLQQRFNSSDGFTGNETWTPSVKVTNENTSEFGQIFGYFQPYQYFYKNFTNVHTHASVNLEFDLVFVGEFEQGVDYVQIQISDGNPIFRTGFYQAAGSTRVWHISENFTHTGSDMLINISSVITKSGSKWGIANFTLSIDKCMDPDAETCYTAYISKTCQYGQYLRYDSIDYVICQDCPAGYPICSETSVDGHRYLTISELDSTAGFVPSSTGFVVPSHAVTNLTSSRWICNGTQFFGPIGPDEYMYKTYTGLSSVKRFAWKFAFTFYRMDNWTGQRLDVTLGTSSGGLNLFNQTFNQSDNGSDYLCQDYFNVSFKDQKYDFNISWQYSDENTNPAIRLSTNLTSALANSWVLASWGISDVALTLDRCIDSFCLTCDNNTHCGLCDQGLYLSGFRCYKSCPIGTYQNSTARTCIDCMRGCDFCTNTTDCQSCTLGFAWNGTNCVDICPLGYWVYNATRSCQPCPARCIECRAPNRCLSCTSTSYFSNGYCLGYCPEGYYKNDSLPIKTCGVCPLPCFGCGSANSNNCTSCFYGQYLLNTSCVTDCKPYGLVNDLLRRKCGVCYTGCDLCTGVGFDECIKCNSSYLLYKGQCVKACPASTYPLPTPGNKTCEPCNSKCYNCTGPLETQCTACNVTFLSGTSCIDPCPDSYYGDTFDFKCKKCNSTCTLCTSLYTCQSCTPNFYLQNANCSTSCVGSFYPNTDTWTCDACDPLCASCTGPSTQNCLSCYAGTYYYNNTCPTTCPVTFYKGDKVCESCPGECKSCYAFDDCDSCHDNYLLDAGRCQLSNCTKPCRTCSGEGADNCLSCETDKFLMGSSCVTSCSKGYVPKSSISNVCVKCTEGCTACIAGDYLIGDKCASSCPAGMDPALLEGVQICITQSRAPSISVVTAPSPTKPVYLSQDLTIQVEISGTGGSPITWWDTLNVLKPRRDQLLQGLNLNSTVLVIPKANLYPNTTYTLVVYASISGDVNSKAFKFTTVADIEEGDIIVNPQTGRYLKTDFTVTLTGWAHPGYTIYFDIYTYYQIYDPIPEQFLQQGLTALGVNLPNNLEGSTTVKFQIPPSEFGRTQYVQIIAHSESQTLITTTSVEVSPLTNEEMKLEVENMRPSDLKKPQDIINFGNAILKVFDISDSEKEAIAAGLKVVENYAKLSDNAAFCMDDVLCHSAGVCNVTGTLRYCTCNEEHAGQYCEFKQADVNIARDKIKLLIDVIVGYQLDNTTAGLVISCLQVLTVQPTFVDVADLTKMLQRAQAIVQTDFVDKKIGSGLIEAMSNLFKAISANPAFKSQALADILRLIDTSADIITSKLAVGESVRTVTDEMENQAISANNALDDVDDNASSTKNGLRMLIKRVSSRRAPQRKKTSKKLKSTTGFKTSRGSSFKVPPISFQAKTSVSFAVQEFKSNQRDATNAPAMASSTTSLTIKDGKNPVTIDKLNDPIVIEIPKLSPTDPKKIKSNFKCSYYDRNTNKFKTDGCEKIGETMHTIICSCTHLTEFGATVEINPNDPPPQINLNTLFQSQESSLITRARNPYTLSFFQKKYDAYIKVVHRTEEPFSFLALFILAPIIAIFIAWFIKSFIRPVPAEENAKAKISSISEILKYKQQIKKQEEKHLHGITAGALFSALTTTRESVKFPKHIRILCFWALMCSMMTCSAALSYVLAKINVFTEASSQFTGKFAVFFAAMVVVILGNLAYDFCLGIIFYCLINKAPPVSASDTRKIKRIRCLQYFCLFTEIIGCIVGTHMIVMINGTVTQYFPWVWLVASVMDFLIVDLGWWVLAVTTENGCFRKLLLCRGFFIENFNEFKYRDDKEDEKAEGTDMTDREGIMDESIFEEDSGKAKAVSSGKASQNPLSVDKASVDPAEINLEEIKEDDQGSKFKTSPITSPKDSVVQEKRNTKKYEDASFMKSDE